MLKNIPREDVLRVMRKLGPTIPVRIVKELGGDTFLLGAMLSELASSKQVLITYLKHGGTPFYYLPEHVYRLVELEKYLNEKDIQTCRRLRTQKVLKDLEQDPLTRVSLRNLKDFAKPLDIVMNGGQELYWKFYTVNNEEVKTIIKEQLTNKSTPTASPTKPEPSSIAKEEIHEEKKEAVIAPQKHISEKKEASPESEKTEEVVKTTRDAEKQKKEVNEEKKAEKEEVYEEKKAGAQDEKKGEEKELKTVEKESQQQKVETEKEKQKTFEKPQEQKPKKDKKVQEEKVEEENAKATFSVTETSSGNFGQFMQTYFKQKDITILEQTVMKKGEIEYTIQLPTPLGKMTYFCVAKDKKKCSEGDLATAYVKGQNKKLPTLLITTGEITKTAKDMLEKEFKGLQVIQGVE